MSAVFPPPPTNATCSLASSPRAVVKLLTVSSNLNSDFCITYSEAFEKRSILFKIKEGEDFNHSNTSGISRIKI